MARGDSEREQKRLAQRYARMTDAELREIAEDPRALTDFARQALSAEIELRRLDISLQHPAEGHAPQATAGPVVLRRYLWLADALIAESVLESAEVDCIFADEHTIHMNALYSLALGGVKVWARARDADAVELLDLGWVESFMVSGVGEYIQPRCPNCHSFEISYKGLLKRPAYMSLLGTWFAGIVPPIALHDLAWRCHECGYLWEEENEASAPVTPTI
ncbi:MAG TPA: hypothetical protein VNK23_15215 [Candidatus Dormibacteraeota bacterium]|nr:hypothetical protein [Candidatus Dormibacteraeota bacterium]